MNEPLRIAVFLGSFPVVSETFILRQITGLLERCHEVDIYADTAGDTNAPVQPEVSRHRLLERTTYMNMPPEVCPWEMPVWPLTGETWLPGAEQAIPNFHRLLRALPQFAQAFLYSPALARQVLSPAEYGFHAASLSALHRLAKLNEVTKRYDVLHAHFGPVGNSYRFVTRLWQAPLLVSFHGYDVSSVPRKDGSQVYAKLFADAAAVTVNSDFMGGKLRALSCPAEKIHKLPYGVDLAQFATSARTRGAADPMRVLTVGRLVEKKGLEYSIRAVAQAREVHPGIRYDIVGEGPLRAKLQTLIAELGQLDAITLHGAKEGDAIRALLAVADVFVLASVTAGDGDEEGTPVSLLEAQAAGVPVIATRHAGIPEIVLDGQSGFLVGERDVAALAGRLCYLIEHPEARRAAGEAGRAFIRHEFAHDRCVDRLLELYQTTRERWRLALQPPIASLPPRRTLPK
jgi:colanic acid/amylovoran biosynthesis glycosyltransferase